MDRFWYIDFSIFKQKITCQLIKFVFDKKNLKMFEYSNLQICKKVLVLMENKKPFACDKIEPSTIHYTFSILFLVF